VKQLLKLVLPLALLALPALAEAQSLPALQVQPDGAGGSRYSLSIETLLLLTSLTLLPATSWSACRCS